MLALELIALLVLVSSTSAAPKPQIESGTAVQPSIFAARLLAADRVEDPVLRATQRAAVFFEARDFSAVLNEVDRGLQVNPHALELLWRAAASELWLKDGPRAQAWIQRLRDDSLLSDLEPDLRQGWLAAASDFEAQATEMIALEGLGEAALVRARICVAVVLTCVALAVLALIRSRPSTS